LHDDAAADGDPLALAAGEFDAAFTDQGFIAGVQLVDKFVRMGLPGGFDNFFYLFSYEDSRDAFGIPHDIRMLDSVFRCPEGTYNEKNEYWSAWGIPAMVASLPEDRRLPLERRIAALRETYDGISNIYQAQKAAGTGADVPL